MTDKTEFSGKVVMVTGASGGLGRAIAGAFAAHGARIALLDINHDAGKVFAAKLADSGAEALSLQADVSDENDVARAVDRIVSTWGRLDIGCNNAGIMAQDAKLADSDTDDFDRTMAVNCRGVYLCMKYAIRQMLSQDDGGHIINMASAAAMVAAPGHCAYNASKHAVIGLTRAAAVEYARQNIHINAICPSVIETDMFRNAWADNPKGKAAVAAAMPVGRAGHPSEVAETVMFLASEGARFVQGHALAVDGGFLST